LKLHLRLIVLIGIIVPRRVRAEWRQEWLAELRWREAMLAEWERLNWKTKLDLLWRSLGAFSDALWMQSYRWEDEMIQDLRLGVRMLLKSPGFTAVAVLSLALGIGANTAIFSLVNTVLFETLPVKEPEQLVLFNWTTGPKSPLRTFSGSLRPDPDTGVNTGTHFPYLIFEQLRAHNQTLSDIFASAQMEQLNVSVAGQPEIAEGQLVSGGYFAGLGGPPLLGRTINESDDHPTANPVTVISHRYWQRRFGGDPSVIGQSININQLTCTVIGVTPPEFFGVSEISDAPALSLPLAFEPQLRSLPAIKEPWNWWLQVMGRLKPGVTLEQAQANLAAVFQQSVSQGLAPYLEPWTTPQDIPALKLVSGSRGLTGLRRAYVRPLSIMMAVVGLVLLIACANVANLLLSRAAARQKEMAMRLALGASRLRLIRQLLTESVLLALAGGALGVALAYWGKDLLVAARIYGIFLPLEVNLDLRVLGFTAAVSLLTGILFGLAPAWRATRIALTPALKDNARSLSGGGSRSLLSKSLVVAQVALSLVLLISAGLFVRTLRNLQSVDAGFNTDHLLLFRVDPRLNGYTGAQIVQLYRRMQERIEALPQVRSATLSRHKLVGRSAAITRGYVEGRTMPREENQVYVQRVGPNFFETMEIPLLVGRSLTPHDGERAAPVAVINQTMARRYFGDENPIGKRFGFSRPENSRQIEVVGVARDAKYSNLRDETPATAYLPYMQPLAAVGQMSFAVRTTGDPAAMTAAIGQAVREVDPNLPLFEISTQREQINASLAHERLFAGLSGLFSALAFLLACIGLYGVMSYAVTCRTNEIGIRMALGARAGDVLRLFIRQGMTLVVIGVTVGLAGALALTRWVASLLFGVSPTDAATFVGVALLFGLIALLACWLPARRATKVDPLAALRHE
jgi:predicted permease